ERQLLGPRLAQVDRRAELLPRRREHAGAAVDTGDAVSAPQQLARDETGACRDVEDACARRLRQTRDEEAAPARVLSEGEDPPPARIARPQRREDPLGEERGSLELHPPAGYV